MKNIYLILCFLCPSLLAAQSIDSAAIKQVDSLITVSRLLTDNGFYEEALKITGIAEQIALDRIGRETAAYGNCCVNRGRVYAADAKYSESEKWYLEAQAIRAKALGKDHLDYGRTFNYLGQLYLDMSQYEQAEQNFLEALAIFEKGAGKASVGYAGILVNLSNMYIVMNLYEKAEPLLFEAKNIFENKLHDTKHPFYKNCLRAMTVLYDKTHNYKQSELLYLQLKGKWEQETNRASLKYAAYLVDFADLYREMGNYKKAESLYLEAKTLYEEKLTDHETHYAFFLNHFATLYQNMGMYEKAESLYLKSRPFLENVYGKESDEYTSYLKTLAFLYSSMNELEKAEILYLESMHIIEKMHGKKHIKYVGTLVNLGSIYTQMNKLKKAEPFLLEAKEIVEDSLKNPDHPYNIHCLKKLSILYEKQGKYAATEPLLSSVSSLQQAQLLKATSFLSEQELAYYTATFQKDGRRLLSFLDERHAKNTEDGNLAALAYDQTLFFKGFLLNAAAKLNKMAMTSPEIEEENNRLKGYRRRLATEYALPINERTGVAELEEAANASEKELARKLGVYADMARQINWQEVQAALQPDAVAIEFVHYRISSDSIVYAALLLKPSGTAPQFIPLFEERQLDKLLQTQNIQAPELAKQLYADAPTGPNRLYELLWQPMEETLADVQTVYFSPTGLIHRLNIGAIAMPSPLRGQSAEGRCLADRFHLVEVSSTRQLIDGGQQIADDASLNNNAILFGGIKYDMDTTAIASANAVLDASNLASRSRGLDFEQADSTLRGDTWKYLSWTNVEVKTVEGILAQAGIKPVLRKDYEATEEAFKAIGVDGRSPRILHLATHGFFFPDPKSRDEEGGMLAPLGRDDEPVFKISEHPMIRSGLLLAGGNHAWESGRPAKPGMEDGILTAYEISQINLKNTELVVLSACETGLGDIQANEGVYGLQRAFKIAGAKYLIMSLWQVADYQTQQLMSTFYRKWLNDKMTIPDAFRSAQQAMREKYKDPFLWAGFVLVE